MISDFAGVLVNVAIARAISMAGVIGTHISGLNVLGSGGNAQTAARLPDGAILRLRALDGM